MVKIKIHALYDHFPERTPQEGDRFIDMYCDTYVKECKKGSRTNVAMLLEPRSMINDAYDYVYEHNDYFSRIYTHDSRILQFSHARMLNWADVWVTSDCEKTKGISICTSFKNWCPLHRARLELANKYKDSDQVDVFFGDWSDPNTTIDAKDYLQAYKYSIVIENDIDQFWYTEKILNCFANKVVPIYVGATKINEIFNPAGIIQLGDWHQVPKLIDELDLERDYAMRQQAINDNFKRVEPFKTPWKERFFRDYEKELEDLIDG